MPSFPSLDFTLSHDPYSPRVTCEPESYLTQNIIKSGMVTPMSVSCESTLAQFEMPFLWPTLGYECLLTVTTHKSLAKQLPRYKKNELLCIVKQVL